MNGKTSITCLLDDYVLLADAYIDLYQATFNLHWLTEANELTEYAIKHFRDPTNGLFFFTPDNSEALIARKEEIEDNVIPSSNSVMANALYRLGTYYDQQTYIHDAKQMLSDVMRQIPSALPYFANWAQLVGIVKQGPIEIAVMGKEAEKKGLAMQKRYLPTSLFMGGEKENLPLLENKLVPGETIIYVCENKVCKLPVRGAQQALQQIKPLLQHSTKMND